MDSYEIISGKENDQNINADFCIKIDFEKDSINPSRIFKAMSGLIDSLQIFDSHLITAINSNIKPIILLEDIETGSLKTWLKQRLEDIDDNDLKKLDWKRLVGTFLVKAKYIAIDFLGNRIKITDANEIIVLQKDIVTLAEQTDVKQMPFYNQIPARYLIQDISNIQNSLAILDKKDSAFYMIVDKTAKFNLELSISPESVEELITKESIENNTDMILKVKKPDYLGESKWDFVYDDRAFPAKITDYEWLNKFQNRDVNVRPGDSIRAKVHTIVKYGHDNNVVTTQNNIIKVINVIEANETDQMKMFPEGEQ